MGSELLSKPFWFIIGSIYPVLCFIFQLKPININSTGYDLGLPAYDLGWKHNRSYSYCNRVHIIPN